VGVGSIRVNDFGNISSPSLDTPWAITNAPENNITNAVPRLAADLKNGLQKMVLTSLNRFT
jgi:hypothetical protein